MHIHFAACGVALINYGDGDIWVDTWDRYNGEILSDGPGRWAGRIRSHVCAPRFFAGPQLSP